MKQNLEEDNPIIKIGTWTDSRLSMKPPQASWLVWVINENNDCVLLKAIDKEAKRIDKDVKHNLEIEVERYQKKIFWKMLKRDILKEPTKKQLSEGLRLHKKFVAMLL